jgi:hypothetical protein
VRVHHTIAVGDPTGPEVVDGIVRIGVQRGKVGGERFQGGLLVEEFLLKVRSDRWNLFQNFLVEQRYAHVGDSFGDVRTSALQVRKLQHVVMVCGRG